MSKFASNSGFWALLVFLALVPYGADFLGLGYLLSVVTRVMIMALAASALNLIMGYGSMVSFGHAAYIGIGAYAVGILSFHAFEQVPIFGLSASNEAPIAWLIAVCAGAGAALLIGSLCLRTRGVYFIMITLAFAQMFYFFFSSLEYYGGDDGLSLWWGRNTLMGMDLSDRVTFYYVVFSIVAVWLIVLRRMMGSPFGQIIKATRQNEMRLAAIGITPYRWKLVAFVISGAVCGLAGALLANLDGFVSPAAMHWSRSGELMIMVILGGLGTIVGPVIGAATIIFLHEFLVAYTEHWELVLGVILLVCVMTMRGGIASIGRFGRD